MYTPAAFKLDDVPRLHALMRKYPFAPLLTAHSSGIAVTHLPFDSPDVADILADLNSDSARLATIRSRNLREAALRHDWLYRIETVFDTLGLKPTEEMQSRADRLARVARQADARLMIHA